MTKTYRTLKPIQRIIKKKNFLGGEVKVNNGIAEYFIPICSIDINKCGKKDLTLAFNTLDVNTGNISQDTYQEFLMYLKSLSHKKLNSFQRNVNDKFGKYVDYVSGEFTMPIGAIRKDFTLAKKRYTTLKILSKDDYSVIMLFSPDNDKAWISRLGIKQQKLSQHNLKNIVYLLKNHLFNEITAIKVFNTHFNLFRKVLPVNVKTKNHQLLLTTIYGELKIKLNNFQVRFETPINGNPRLRFIYNQHNEIDLILNSPRYSNLINLLTQN